MHLGGCLVDERQQGPEWYRSPFEQVGGYGEHQVREVVGKDAGYMKPFAVGL